MSDYGPSIKVARVFEKTSKSGNRYFIGRWGGARIVLLKSKDAAEDGPPIWDVLLQEAPAKSDDKPQERPQREPSNETKPTPSAADERAKRDYARPSLDDPIPF